MMHVSPSRLFKSDFYFLSFKFQTVKEFSLLLLWAFASFIRKCSFVMDGRDRLQIEK